MDLPTGTSSAHKRDPSRTRRRLIQLVVLVPVFIGASLYLGAALQIGCNTDTFPDRGDAPRMCDATGGDGGFPIRWWLLVLAPTAVLLLSQLVPWCRRNLLRTATAIALVAAAGWTFVLMVVNGNIGD
jgi:hypothetical protein